MILRNTYILKRKNRTLSKTQKTVTSNRPLINSVAPTSVCMFLQVNLMQYMKLSTSRDFRINPATLDAALQEQDNSQEVSAVSFCNKQLYTSQ